MRKNRWLCIYTAMHFIVDLACIYFLTGLMIPIVGNYEKWLFLAVFYNALAFALPMLVGTLADLYHKNALLASIGCFGVMVAYILYKQPILAVAFLGTGNGLFHIGGGRQILLEGKEKYAPCGIFISSGALGVYLGSFFGKNYYPVWNIMFVLILLCVVILWVLRKKDGVLAVSDGTVLTVKNRGCLMAIFLALLFVVCIRSYYGTILHYSWKSGFWMGLIFTLGIAGGKFFGGILADKAGINQAIVISLGIAGITALFSFSSPIAGCISIFFFNMTMPLTLSLMYQLMRARPGFAFGALMFALFLGTLPTMIYDMDCFFTPAGLCGMCFVSLVLLLLARYPLWSGRVKSSQKGGVE